MTKAEIHVRFRDVLARGLARAEREQAEHLASLRPTRGPLSHEERRRIHGMTVIRRRPR